MSDDESDRNSEHSDAGSSEEHEASLQENPQIYRVLRDFCDVPKLETYSVGTVYLPRHNAKKKVVLVATLYHVYLFKKKGLKFYIRWPSRYLSLARRGTSVYFSLNIDAEMVADEHQELLRRLEREGGGRRRRQSSHNASSDEDENDDRRNMDDNQDDNTFTACRFICDTDVEASNLLSQFVAVVAAAKDIAKRHADEEEGKIKVRKRVKLNVDTDDDGGDKANEDDLSGDSDEDGVDDAQVVYTRVTAIMQAAAQSSTKMLRSAPSRYIAVASLVDGEFADYTALKNAYLRNEDGSLLEDLNAFIADNEAQVESTCRQHYPAFLHAARQCSTITHDDAEAVRDELSAAMKLVREAAVEMKQSASTLLISKGVRDQMLASRALLERMAGIARLLEDAEAQLKADQLASAAASLRSITTLVGALSDYAIGEYILHRCIPRLYRRISAAAQLQLNKWLSMLRFSAPTIGREFVELGGHQAGGVSRGRYVRKVSVSEDTGSWCLVSEFVPCTIRAPSATSESKLAAVAPQVVLGSKVQRVFSLLGIEDKFRLLYVEARWKQLQADLLQPPRIPPSDPLQALKDYAYVALGVLLLEDMVINATRPQAVQTDSDLIRLWQGVCSRISEMALASEPGILMPLPTSTSGGASGGEASASSPTTAGGFGVTTTAAASTVNKAVVSAPIHVLLDIFRAMLQAIRSNLSSAALSPLPLTRVAEQITSRLHSVWVMQCREECCSAVLDDTLSPIPISTPQEYTAYVSRFYLHRATRLDLPVQANYRAGSITVPYALLVPFVGDRLVTLLQHCYRAQMGSEVNNFDSIILGYLNVILRGVHGSLQGVLAGLKAPKESSTADGSSSSSPLKLGVVITSCAAMTVVLSSVEMELLTRSSGYGEEGEESRQYMGMPRLLAPVSTLFSQLSSTGIEQLNQLLQDEATVILRPMFTTAYWKGRVAGKAMGGGGGGGSHDGAIGSSPSSLACLLQLHEASEKRLTALKVVLQPSILRNVITFLHLHVGTACYNSFESALDLSDKDMTLMKACVAEYQKEVAECFPRLTALMEKLAQPLAVNGVLPPSAATKVVLKCPFDFGDVVKRSMKLVAAREEEIAEEKARNLLLANLDAAKDSIQAAGAAVVSGVADVGKAAGKGFWKIGKTVKEGVTGKSPRAAAAPHS